MDPVDAKSEAIMLQLNISKPSVCGIHFTYRYSEDAPACSCLGCFIYLVWLRGDAGFGRSPIMTESDCQNIWLVVYYRCSHLAAGKHIAIELAPHQTTDIRFRWGKAKQSNLLMVRILCRPPMSLSFSHIDITVEATQDEH